MMTWIWIILAILYVLSRIDLIPDVVPGWGWLDDILVLVLLYRYLRKAGRLARTTTRSQDNQQRPDAPDDRERKDPYDILEIPRSATTDDIRTAYRRLAAQYHPDKVAHLGKEFREMAENRFKEIQQAYDQLMKQ